VTKPTESFGRRVTQAESSSALLELERIESRRESFTRLDMLLGTLLVRVLQSERIVSLVQDKTQASVVKVQGLKAAERKLVNEMYSLDQQQTRGAWFLPESVSLKVGMMALPALFREHPRFANGLAWEERSSIPLGSSADAVLLWSVLEPLFETLFLPFELRGRLVGAKSREEQLQSWEKVDGFLAALGFEVQAELAIMRYGGGWHRLQAPAQVEAKQRLLGTMAHQVEPEMGARYRAYRIQELVRGYYQKAKKGGQVKRRQALTKALERTLSGFFGGDWLAWLAYLGEQPHPDEQIATALPEAKLYVGAKAKAAEVAAHQGLPVEEVERMLAAFWQHDQSASPVEQRTAVLERYWRLFDEIHARQVRGMKPLWGLVDDVGFVSLKAETESPSPYQAGLYRELLPADLVTEVEQHWGAIMLPRWPDRIVTEPSAHALMARALGPAITFWQGCALTAWFICEGPLSRTDMAGLAEYYKRELAALEDLGTPIAAILFQELLSAERQLGPPQPIERSRSTTEIAAGISFTITTSMGSRRAGFERVRDIITHHRRTWTEQYFGRYLRGRWESEIREAARAYHVLVNERGKRPTAKQFAKAAEVATNHWFGGDLSGLYRAFGEKSPIQPQRIMLLPADREGFVKAVFAALGGTPFGRQQVVSDQREQTRQNEAYERFKGISGLARNSIWYVQLEEALGRPPELKEFGRSKFEWQAPALHMDIEEAWCRYAAAIGVAKLSISPSHPVQAVLERSEAPHVPAFGSQGAGDDKSSAPDQAPARKRTLFDRLFGR
jgi:hypothetical protein